MMAEDARNQLSEESTRFLQRIQSASDHMDTLIVNMLQLARVSAQTLRRGQTDLVRIATDVITRLRSEDTTRDVTVILPEKLSVECDESLMRIVLENLLSNAWKFTG